MAEIHKPFTDDGVTYCGWDGHEGCGEVWPCSTIRAEADRIRERRGNPFEPLPLPDSLREALDSGRTETPPDTDENGRSTDV